MERQRVEKALRNATAQLRGWDPQDALRLIAHVTSAEAVVQQAALDLAAVQEATAEALREAGVPTRDATALATKLAETELPAAAAGKVREAEKAGASRLVEMMGTSESEAAGHIATLAAETLLLEELRASAAAVLGAEAARHMDMDTVAALWLEVRRLAIRAEVFAESRDRLYGEIVRLTTETNGLGRLEAQREDVESERLTLLYAKGMLRNSLKRTTVPAGLTVVRRATTSAYEAIPSMARQVASIMITGIIVAIGVGLGLAAIGPRRDG
jgi:hypothetical protein